MRLVQLFVSSLWHPAWSTSSLLSSAIIDFFLRATVCSLAPEDNVINPSLFSISLCPPCCPFPSLHPLPATPHPSLQSNVL